MILVMSSTIASMTARKLARADLAQAVSDYAVANTPLFLLRKLRVNQTVADIARLASGPVILSELRQALSRRPRTLRGAVLPYALLVALSMTSNTLLLRRAATLRAPHHEWFTYLCEVLSNGSTPTVTSTIQLPTSPKSKDVKTKGLAVTQF
jgi:hypothetical protein